MIVHCLRRLFGRFQRLLKAQTQKVWFEIKFKDSLVDVKFACRHFDIGKPNAYDDEFLILADLELWNQHHLIKDLIFSLKL